MGSADATLSEEGTKVPVQLGQILLDKYRVERVLGSGGMGVVVAATHLQLDEPVAIKFLLPAAMDNPEAVARFSREARAAVKIKSEHVGRVIDVGSLESGAPYIVMEYLEGSDLSQLLMTRGAFAIDEAVEYVLHACDAIAHAHVLGIVHRDLKPANLFLTHRPDGSPIVKVLDFGISKFAVGGGSSSDPSITRTSATIGSPLYMSPEQMASARDVDQRADIWSLGAILYELLSGRPPFAATTMPQICLQIMQGTPDPLRSVCPAAPTRLQEVIDRCLRKDPAERFQNVGDLAAALAAFGPRRAEAVVDSIFRVFQSAPPSSHPASSKPASDSRFARTDAPWSRTKNRPRSQVLAWIGTATLGAVALASAAFLIGRTSNRSPDGSGQSASSSGPLPTNEVASSGSVALSAYSDAAAGPQPVASVAYPTSQSAEEPIGEPSVGVPSMAPPIASSADAPDGLHVDDAKGSARGARPKPLVKTNGITNYGRKAQSPAPTPNPADLLRDRK